MKKEERVGARTEVMALTKRKAVYRSQLFTKFGLDFRKDKSGSR